MGAYGISFVFTLFFLSETSNGNILKRVRDEKTVNLGKVNE